MKRSARGRLARIAAKRYAAGLALTLLAGCAAYDGRGLVPGRSTMDDVLKLMGTPAERIRFSDGRANWYYTTGPMGRTTHVVRFSPEGLEQSVEQVLTVQSVAKLVPGVTTDSGVKEIIGPPNRVTRLERQQRNVWEYRMYNDVQDDFNLYVQLSDDNIVREVLLLKDYYREPGGRGRGGR